MIMLNKLRKLSYVTANKLAWYQNIVTLLAPGMSAYALGKNKIQYIQ